MWVFFFLSPYLFSFYVGSNILAPSQLSSRVSSHTPSLSHVALERHTMAREGRTGHCRAGHLSPLLLTQGDHYPKQGMFFKIPRDETRGSPLLSLSHQSTHLRLQVQAQPLLHSSCSSARRHQPQLSHLLRGSFKAFGGV